MDEQKVKETLISWRHTLHAHPETAFEEVETARFVADKLRAMGCTVHEGIGGTGVVADLTVGDGKKVIGLRADMDAINVKEVGTPHLSIPESWKNACLRPRRPHDDPFGCYDPTCRVKEF